MKTMLEEMMERQFNWNAEHPAVDFAEIDPESLLDEDEDE